MTDLIQLKASITFCIKEKHRNDFSLPSVHRCPALLSSTSSSNSIPSRPSSSSSTVLTVDEAHV